MLFRDVLDIQMLDRKGEKIGKVDGIVAVLRKDKPPQVSHLECGPTVLARRVHPKVEEWARWLLTRFGPKRADPVRIPWAKVKAVHLEVHVDVDVEKEMQHALDWEHWLRDHFIGRIPGAR